MVRKQFPALVRSMIQLICLASFALAGMAQSGRGTLEARVADTANAVLQGAQVTLQPGDYSSATNTQGELTITNLRPGKYTLSISYVGFSTFQQEVNIAAGQSLQVNAVLKVAGKNDEIMVTADRPHGEAEAINRQRTADNIIDVLPSDVIRSLPNANIADAVGRLPGVTLEGDEGEGKYVQIRGTEPRLSNVTVDGVEVPAPEDNVRQVKLDTIPSGIVEAVEVNKTLSASQDADAIGGTVNLRTKTAGNLPTLTLEGLGGFTPIVNTRYVGEITGTVGQRFGANKRFGALFSGSYDYNGRGIDDIEPQPDPAHAIPYYDSMDLREYRYKRTRWGIGGSLDYKLNEGSGLFLHYFYSDFKDYGDKWVYTINDAVHLSSARPAACPITESGRWPSAGNMSLKTPGLRGSFPWQDRGNWRPRAIPAQPSAISALRLATMTKPPPRTLIYRNSIPDAFKRDPPCSTPRNTPSLNSMARPELPRRSICKERYPWPGIITSVHTSPLSNTA